MSASRSVFVRLPILIAAVMAAATAASAPNGSCGDEPGSTNQIESEIRDGLDWTVKTSVAVRYLVSDQKMAGYWPRAEHDPSPIVYSPDKNYFFFVVRHGDLLRDCQAHELRVYSVESLLKGLSRSPIVNGPQHTPWRIVEKCSARSDSWHQAIYNPRWSPDSRSIVFVGVDADGPRQLYRLNLDDGRVTLMSDPKHDVYGYALSGDGLIYDTENAPNNIASDKYPIDVVDVNYMRRSLHMIRASGYSLYSSYKGGDARFLMATLDSAGVAENDNWISPNADMALVLRAPAENTVPAPWLTYDGIAEAKSAAVRDDHDWRVAARRFLLVDIARGTIKPIFDAPSGLATLAGGGLIHRVGYPDVMVVPPAVLWSPDSRRAIIVNTALPLSQHSPERARVPYIIDYDVSSGQWSIISAISPSPIRNKEIDDARSIVQEVAWTIPGREFRIVSGTSERRYALVAEHWILRNEARRRTTLSSTPGHQSKRLDVSVVQSANDPPIVVVSDGMRREMLSAPDPALVGVHRARIEDVTWKEPDGLIAHGGLMLPRGVRPGDRVPLVIQAYHWLPNQFLPDGSASTAYAAQPLAARGIAVLFLDIPIIDKPEVGDQPAELTSFVDRIDAAVESLAEAGTIDPNRVGLIGFSRGGYMTYYAVTHPGRIRLAAAVEADGWTGGYLGYLLEKSVEADSEGETAQQYGGGTFWKNKKGWLDRTPAFNLDRVQTPVLFTYVNSTILSYYASEFLAGFHLNNKPVEIFVLPRGEHQLQTPREREASLEASVDWMTYWLLNCEELSGTTADRLARWRYLRQQYQAGKQTAEFPPN